MTPIGSGSFSPEWAPRTRGQSTQMFGIQSLEHKAQKASASCPSLFVCLLFSQVIWCPCSSQRDLMIKNWCAQSVHAWPQDGTPSLIPKMAALSWSLAGSIRYATTGLAFSPPAWAQRSARTVLWTWSAIRWCTLGHSKLTGQSNAAWVALCWDRIKTFAWARLLIWRLYATSKRQLHKRREPLNWAFLPL